MMAPKKKASIKQINLSGPTQNQVVSKLGISKGIVSKKLKRIRNHDSEGNLRSKKQPGGLLKTSPNTDK